MSRSVWRILFLVFQAFWLNVVLPGHTRGIVVMPCSEPAAGQRHACCAKPASSNEDPRDSRDRRESSDRASRCAVCFYAVRLTLPPPFHVELRPLAFVGPSQVVCPLLPTKLHRSLPYDGRGPPVA